MSPPPPRAPSAKYSPRPPAQGAIAPRASVKLRVRHHQLRVHLEAGTEAVAGRAGAVGGVEAEVARGSSSKERPQSAHARCWVNIICLVAVSVAGDELHLGHAFAEAQGSLERVRETPFDPRLHQPVDHHLDGVVLVAGELERSAR